MDELKPKAPGIRMMNFSRVELPKITETTHKEWVEFGDKNQYPQELIELLNTSAIHNAIVAAKAKAVAGAGVTLNETATVEARAIFDKFSQSPNAEDDLEDLLAKTALDYEANGAFAWEIIWQTNGTKIAEINHIDVADIRTGKMVDGQVANYWYSTDWSQTRKAAHTPVSIPAFNPENSGDGRQLLYVKDYRPGSKYYGVPTFASALSWIKMDASLGLFHLSNLENGFNPGMIFNFKNSIPTPEEQDQIHRDIIKRYQGPQNAGRFILLFNETDEQATEVTPVETSQIDQLYVVLNDMIIQNILTAHRVTSPMLLGVKTPGQLGGGTELQDAYQIFDRTVLAPNRTRIQKTLNKLMPFIAPGIQVTITPLAPIDFTFSETVLQQIMTVKELRDRIGLPDLTAEELESLSQKLTKGAE